MNWLLLAVLAGAFVSLHAADIDNYPDIPEDLFVERLANRLHRQRAQPADAYLDVADDAAAAAEEEDVDVEPDFTFQFPPDVAGAATSPFVRPPDPRYYHDTRRPMTADVGGAAATQDDDVFAPPRTRPSPPPSAGPSPATSTTSPATSTAPPGSELVAPAQGDLGVRPRIGFDAHAHDDDDEVLRKPLFALGDQAGVVFFTIVFVCCSVAVMIVLVIALAWVKLTRRAKAAADVEYPAYGVTGPQHQKEPSPTGDRKLAQSAQMYHYQHQKQQIIAMQSRAGGERRGSAGSPAESDDDNDEGDYTVYECPGLAPTGEMEVKNPLFHDEPTPATPPPPPKVN